MGRSCDDAWKSRGGARFADPKARRARIVGYHTGTERNADMFAFARKAIVHGWNYVFNHQVSPLRHIPDIAIRHYVLQLLGLMWAVSFAVATGSYTILAESLIGHTVLIGAAAITVATWTTASVKPGLFVGFFRRRAARR
jgi:hypothetical protein